jgi:DNA (cytosine-5)-methyltransferase 3A
MILDKNINVLSLFDGMSCGQIALNKLGIKYDNYFASEIDERAISVTMDNYPNTIQLGSVINVDTTKLPKIDLLIGGSPCQSFSLAGTKKGMIDMDYHQCLH